MARAFRKVKLVMMRYYQIMEGCVACGACKAICPKHCISKGKPYVIRQNQCIGCGLCVGRCWRKMICLVEQNQVNTE